MFQWFSINEGKAVNYSFVIFVRISNLWALEAENLTLTLGWSLTISDLF
jgi:hypothetical protein